MPNETSPTTRRSPLEILTNGLDWIGFSGLLLMGVLTPLFLLPMTLIPWFDPIDPEQVVGKESMMQIFSAISIFCLSLRLIFPFKWKEFSSQAILPAVFLFLFLGWGTISVLLNPLPKYTYSFWSVTLLAGISALGGAIFFRDVRRVRWLLLGLVIAGIVVALIGIIGWSGFRGFYRFFYGFDPRDESKQAARMLLQGGKQRLTAMSTLFNPEYTGGYCAMIAGLASALLLAWSPLQKARWIWRGVFVGAMGLLLLLLGLTGTRQPWISLVFGALLYFGLQVNVPLRRVAFSFCAVLAAYLVGGALTAAIAAVLVAVFVGGAAFADGSLMEAVRRTSRFNLGVVFFPPVFAVILFAAFSVPGPWNPTGLRVAERFASAFSNKDRSLRERSIMFLVSAEMAVRNPILGVGPGRYTNQFSLHLGDLASADETGVFAEQRLLMGDVHSFQSHNDFLQIAAETGVVGIVLFLTMLLFLLDGLVRRFREGDEESRALAMGLLTVIAVTLCTMFTSFPLQSPERACLFWTLIGAALGLIAQPLRPTEQAS